MKFRTAVTLTILLSLSATLSAVVSVVSVVLERSARRDLTTDLLRDRQAFGDMLEYRKSLHRSKSRILADEPRLKAVVATDDVSPATVVGVMADLRRAMRCDLLLLTDPRGVLVADAAHPEETGVPLADVPVVATALTAGESEGVWIDGPQVFQVQGRRLSFGAQTVGTIIVGYRIDDAMADLVGRHVGAGVVVLLDGQVVAASSSAGPAPLAREGLGAALSGVVPGAVQAPTEIKLAGQRYLLSTGPLPEYGGRQSLHVALLRSLDGAMAAARRLVGVLLGITALALALAMWAALFLSRRLSRPIDELVAFAGRIASGDLKPTALTGMGEVRTLGRAMNDMVQELSASRAQIAEKTRMARELEIAQRIQTSILPREMRVPGLALAAQMLPATEVGGDYYDVIPCQDGCWIGVGDVAGHGLSAGLVMLMVQSAFAALVRTLPEATPRELVVALNQLIYDNVRNRLQSDEHVTFTAIRYFSDGRLVFAGAHEPILIRRQATGECDLVNTPGTWLGVIPDIAKATRDTVVALSRGDVIVLYSDGVIEATSQTKEQLGMPRLQEALRRSAASDATAASDGRKGTAEGAVGAAGLPAPALPNPTEIHAQLLSVVRNWSTQPDDDITLLVLCHEGVAGP
jgi:sigma-B regulation protein RsbU (phosphoserine phosphatase)